MEQNNFISVTYTDGNDNTYTDTLHPSELQSIPRQWFDRILYITILPVRRDEPPRMMDGEEVRRFLQTIIS